MSMGRFIVNHSLLKYLVHPHNFLSATFCIRCLGNECQGGLSCREPDQAAYQQTRNELEARKSED